MFSPAFDNARALIDTEVQAVLLCQRLWAQPHWHAAALLLCVPRRSRLIQQQGPTPSPGGQPPALALIPPSFFVAPGAIVIGARRCRMPA